MMYKVSMKVDQCQNQALEWNNLEVRISLHYFWFVVDEKTLVNFHSCYYSCLDRGVDEDGDGPSNCDHHG